jgi:hypothetical protein
MEKTTSAAPSSWTISRRTVIVVVVSIGVVIILGCSIGIPLQKKADDDAKKKAETESKVTTPTDTVAKATSDAIAKATADAIAKATADAIAKATADAEAKAKADAESKAKAEAEAKATAAAKVDSPEVIYLKALADSSSGEKRAMRIREVDMQRVIEAKKLSGAPLTQEEQKFSILLSLRGFLTPA